MLNCKEAAEKLGVKIDTLRGYCRNGKIDFENQGGRYMFTDEAIRAFKIGRKNRLKGTK